MTAITRRRLGRARMLSFLSELGQGGEAQTVYIPAGQSGEPPLSLDPELGKLISGSLTGSALFLGREKGLLVLPPFPIRTSGVYPGYATEPLRSALTGEYHIALMLVRLGAYAVGLAEGERLISSKVGTGLVHGRHRQGGSSQQRFRRHREKQIEYFLTRVCSHAREQLEPRAREIDYIIYGGAWTTILMLEKRCPFLSRFHEHTLPPLLDIPEPRQAVLENALSRAWSSQVIEWERQES